MSSLARTVAVRGVGILVATLVGVGLVTGLALHVVQVRMLDRALLAAALGHAHPEVPGGWEAEHVELPLEAFQVVVGDPRVPADEARRALHTERPTWVVHDDHRVVLVVAEREGGHEHREEHVLVAARVPNPTLVRTVGRFALIYGLASALASVAAGVGLSRLVRRAFAPVDRARADAARVLGLGQGQRLTEDGPDEVRGLLAALNALLDRLDSAHLAQSRFTAEAAHELRTPVAAMLGELDVALRRDRSAAEYRDVLVSAREEVDRLRRLVEGLLALARLDAGEGAGGRARVRLDAVVRDAVAAEAESLRAAGCTVRVDVADPCEVEVHPALLAIAVANLLRNTARHAPGAPVTVRVSRGGGRVRVDVDDVGSGVPAAEREALFDRFARGGAARRDDRDGLGLGLPIAREIARRHGGDCTLADAPGGGLRARLELPVAAGA